MGARPVEVLPLDAIRPVLNPIQRSALLDILWLCHPRQRWKVALAFADLTVTDIATRAGFSETSVSRSRWTSRQDRDRMPLGVAYRLGRVLGIDAVDILFEAHLW